MRVDALLARGLLPDRLVRLGVRRAIATRIAQQRAGGPAAAARRTAAFVEEMRRSPIAVCGAAANAQHYDVPAAFFERVLGPRLKYSAAWWPRGVDDLAAAEEAMLRLTAERAGLADGQRVLDLGCGWGSLSLWLAERHPAMRITAVSNSASQAAFIRAACRARGFAAVEVVTGDVTTWTPAARFDRVVSIEMFEHLRNWGAMLARVRGWLEPDGRVFTHVFAHRHFAYPYEDAGPGDWMARHFFTGGIMPSADLFRRFGDDLIVERGWRLSGRHYARTAAAWLGNMDRDRAAIMRVFRDCYGREAQRFWHYWRTFFMAVEELWGWAGGREWVLAQQRLRPARG